MLLLLGESNLGDHLRCLMHQSVSRAVKPRKPVAVQSGYPMKNSAGKKIPFHIFDDRLDLAFALRVAPPAQMNRKSRVVLVAFKCFCVDDIPTILAASMYILSKVYMRPSFLSKN